MSCITYFLEAHKCSQTIADHAELKLRLQIITDIEKRTIFGRADFGYTLAANCYQSSPILAPY